MAVDDKGRRVLTFETALRNASRLGTYADLIVGMYESTDWRAYATALGPERWRAHEFDFFLISRDARYADLVRIFSWDTVRAARIAEAMTGEPGPHRRSLEEASRSWPSPTGQSLIERARDNGWLSRGGPTNGAIKSPPIPKRARQLITHRGISRDEYTRRQREKRLSRPQIARLDRLAEETFWAAGAGDADEVRYLIGKLMKLLRNATKHQQKA